MKTLRERLKTQLKSSREYRHAYADEILNLKVASLIRVLREQNGMKQGDLAKHIGTTQPGISRLESANYAGWSVATLKKLAEAFDLRLDIDFKDFGSLWRDIDAIDADSLKRVSFGEDPEFKDSAPRGEAFGSMQQYFQDRQPEKQGLEEDKVVSIQDYKGRKSSAAKRLEASGQRRVGELAL